MDSLLVVIVIILAVLVIGIALWVIVTYNALVRAREFVRNGMGQIAAQVESRWDAVSNLIEATKRYSEHEATTLAHTTDARSRITNSATPTEVTKDDEAFAGVLGRITAVAENYPDLKASDVYQSTMQQVAEFENKVRHSRMFFNDSVTKYNNRVLTFPSSIVAGMFNFATKEYFENTESKAQMPRW